MNLRGSAFFFRLPSRYHFTIRRPFEFYTTPNYTVIVIFWCRFEWIQP